MSPVGPRSGLLGWVMVTAGALIAASLGPRGPATAQPASPRPNIVLILTDDEDRNLHAFMPKTKALLEDRGVTFDNYFVTYAICCPSRASILRGQYPHNHRIRGNKPPTGGYEKFRAMGHDSATIATWLRDAGYHTALLGKYLNRYRPDADGVPPGWAEWYVGGNAHRGFGYTLNENGALVAYGDRPEDYLTDVLAGKATEVIHRAARTGRPLFLYVAPYTPHSPATPAPRHAHLFADAALPRPPSFNEADVSDKPAFIRDLPPLDGSQIAANEERYRNRLRSLQAIDDMVEGIVSALRETKRLENTYIVYTSDNGFHMGEHRLVAGKDTPYEEDIRVPFIVRGPNVPAGQRLDPIVLNIDLAPTFAEIAGAEPPDFVDGRSFLPLLADPDRPWREGFLVERRQLPARGIAGWAGFNALRTADWTYVEYGDGERELYNHEDDPHQLQNLAAEAAPSLRDALSSRLAELVNCAAAACRELEDASVGGRGALLQRR